MHGYPPPRANIFVGRLDGSRNWHGYPQLHRGPLRGAFLFVCGKPMGTGGVMLPSRRNWLLVIHTLAPSQAEHIQFTAIGQWKGDQAYEHFKTAPLTHKKKKKTEGGIDADRSIIPTMLDFASTGKSRTWRCEHPRIHLHNPRNETSGTTEIEFNNFTFARGYSNKG